jgi:hypothetical protein
MLGTWLTVDHRSHLLPGFTHLGTCPGAGGSDLLPLLAPFVCPFVYIYTCDLFFALGRAFI